MQITIALEFGHFSLCRVCVMYTKICEQDKRRLVQCFNGGGDYQQLARQLNIKKSTAWAIVKRANANNGVAAQARGGFRWKKLDDEMMERVCQIVDDHPEYTLAQINANLRISLPAKPAVSSSTLARALSCQLITMKLLSDSPTERNSEATKEKRKEYAQWLLQSAVHHELIFIDETGFNLWLCRTRGRSQRGQRAVRIVNHRRGNNLTIVFAVSNTRGLVHYEICEGGMDGERFVNLLQNIANNVPMHGQVVFIFDNAPAHRRAASGNLPANVSLRWLPPYSPFLNIVENTISIWKAKTKALLAEVRDGMLLMQHGEKLVLLTQLAEEAVDVITQEKVIGFYHHMHQYLPMCIQKISIM